MRRIATKMVEAAKSNEEIASFMESIPEWGDYAQGELRLANEIMNKPLGQESTKRKKSQFQSEHEDDIFVQNFLKRFSKGGEDDEDEEDGDENVLKHSDSYERSGRVDLDEEILGIG
jgi:hypothetical protein